MKKLLSLLFVCLSWVSVAHGQTTIKSNALYWAVGIPNVGVETRLGEHLSFNVDLTASLWQEIGGRPYMGGQLIPEVRYYPKAVFKGFYVGGFAGFDVFHVSKWDHPATEIQNGVGLCLGATIGYQLSIGGRWTMDFYAGAGWHLSWYYGTNTISGEKYADWNRSAEWIPYKLGVTFAYKLGKQ